MIFLFVLKIFILRLTVDSHAVVINNAERSLVPLPAFSQWQLRAKPHCNITVCDMDHRERQSIPPSLACLICCLFIATPTSFLPLP